MTLQDIMPMIEQLSPSEQLQLKRILEDHMNQPLDKQVGYPDLHPNAIILHDDFFEPLPDEFWLGEM